MRTVRLVVCALVFYWVVSGIFDLPWRTVAAVAVSAAVIAWWAVDPFAKLGRTAALILAIWSHGPAAGVESDRCFIARAEHNLHWFRTGENRRVVPRDPDRVRRCVNCGVPEWCLDHHTGDDIVYPHTFEHVEDITNA